MEAVFFIYEKIEYFFSWDLEFGTWVLEFGTLDLNSII